MRWSKEMLAWLRDNCNGVTNDELTILFNEKWNTDVTSHMIKSTLSNHHIKRDYISRQWLDDYWNEVYPEDVRKFIDENHKGIPQKQMMVILNQKFGTNYSHGMMKHYYRKYGYCSGLTGHFSADHPAVHKHQFKKGERNSISTEYKKGNKPHNYLEVGTVVKDYYGYWKKKIADPNKWQYMHKLVWEKANGKIPKGKMIIFLDGNYDNYQLDNLMLVSKAENAKLNVRKYRVNNPDAVKIGVTSIRIEDKLKELKRR